MSRISCAGCGAMTENHQVCNTCFAQLSTMLLSRCSPPCLREVRDRIEAELASGMEAVFMEHGWSREEARFVLEALNALLDGKQPAEELRRVAKEIANRRGIPHE